MKPEGTPPTPTPDGDETPPTAAERACAYILDRIQTDPDLYYVCGPMTETFHLLCAAQAEFTGEPIEEVKELRSVDLQPPYRKRKPEVLRLREELEALRG